VNIRDIHYKMNYLVLEISFEYDADRRYILYNQYQSMSELLCMKRAGAEFEIKKLKEDLKCQNK